MSTYTSCRSIACNVVVGKFRNSKSDECTNQRPKKPFHKNCFEIQLVTLDYTAMRYGLHSLSSRDEFNTFQFFSRDFKVIFIWLFRNSNCRGSLRFFLNGSVVSTRSPILILNDSTVLVKQIDVNDFFGRSIIGDMKIDIANRKQVLILHSPFRSISRQGTIRVPRFVLDHIANIDNNIGQ